MRYALVPVHHDRDEPYVDAQTLVAHHGKFTAEQVEQMTSAFWNNQGVFASLWVDLRPDIKEGLQSNMIAAIRAIGGEVNDK